MILPRATGGWAFARDELIKAAALRIYNRISRRIRTRIQLVRNTVVVRIQLAGERESSVILSQGGYVGPDTQPIRGQRFIANPAFQVSGKRCAGSDDGEGGREPKKIAAA